MWEALLSIIEAVSGMLLILAAWLGFQGFVRRQSGCRSDQDVLDHMAHGCGGCTGTKSCRNREIERKHHELA